ncbi:hypothetical protein [Kribbella sp. NPDC051620]|uniref:hypothetical protein n=1 Tax=Kribbella sp. NPDC051620 TaxID=3364120 RepID=UPI003787511F
MREADCSIWVRPVVSKMAETGEDVYAEMAILARLGQVERTQEVAVGAVIPTGIVGHPAGHLREPCRSGEDAGILNDHIAAEQPGTDVQVQVLDHRGVQMAATNLFVGGPERLHREDVRSVIALRTDRDAVRSGCSGLRRRAAKRDFSFSLAAVRSESRPS